jgi:hypothetical protein
MNGAGLAGFWLTRRFGLAGTWRAAWAVLLVTLIGMDAYALVFKHRVFYIGTEAAWRAGGGTFMFEQRDFLTLLALTTIYLAAALYAGLRRPVAA